MSKLPAQPPVIRLRLEDASGAPLKDASYTFEWREVPGHHVASQTNADGVLTEPILPGAKTARLALFDPTWTVIVAVTPFGDAATTDGLTARLENLGLIALPPSTPLNAADLAEVTKGTARYKELKKLPRSTSLPQVGAAITADHDKI